MTGRENNIQRRGRLREAKERKMLEGVPTSSISRYSFFTFALWKFKIQTHVMLACMHENIDLVLIC